MIIKIVEMFKKAFFEDDNSIKINCPICDTIDVAFDESEYVTSTGYTAWKGQGDCLKIPLWCRNNHKWEIHLGFHKGNTYAYIEKQKEDSTNFGNDQGQSLSDSLR